MIVIKEHWGANNSATLHIKGVDEIYELMGKFQRQYEALQHTLTVMGLETLNVELTIADYHNTHPVDEPTNQI